MNRSIDPGKGKILQPELSPFTKDCISLLEREAGPQLFERRNQSKDLVRE